MCLKYVFQKEDAFKRSLHDVFKTFPRRFWHILQEVFKTCLQDVFFKTSSRRLQKTSCSYILKKSKKKIWRQRNVTLNTSSRPPEDVFSTSSPRRMLARSRLEVFCKKGVSNLAKLIRKHLYWSPLESPTQVFSCEFCKKLHCGWSIGF